MIETRGNLWNTPAQVTVITTNGTVKRDGTCVMGRGCAREARDQFPGIDFKLGTLLTQYGNRPMIIWHDPRIVSFPVKHNWWEVASTDLIIKSAQHLTEMADKFDWSHVLMPRPGCGNGQLTWDGTEGVRAFIAPILDDRFCVTTF